MHHVFRSTQLVKDQSHHISKVQKLIVLNNPSCILHGLNWACDIFSWFKVFFSQPLAAFGWNSYISAIPLKTIHIACELPEILQVIFWFCKLDNKFPRKKTHTPPEVWQLAPEKLPGPKRKETKTASTSSFPTMPFRGVQLAVKLRAKSPNQLPMSLSLGGILDVPIPELNVPEPTAPPKIPPKIPAQTPGPGPSIIPKPGSEALLEGCPFLPKFSFYKLGNRSKLPEFFRDKQKET